MLQQLQARDINDQPHPGHYSHYCLGAGMMFISGLLPATPAGEMLSAAPFADQVLQVFASLDTCLRQENLTRSQLVMVRVYLADMALWDDFNVLYAQWLGSWKPARAVVPVSGLHYGVLLEIEATAVQTR